jgi:hypothetical protein
MGINILGKDQASLLAVDTVSFAAHVTPYDQAGNPSCDVSVLSDVLNALNAAATITLGGQSTVSYDVEGTTGTLTLSFEYTINGTTWYACLATPVSGGAAVSSTSANGQWVASVSGFYAVRARVSSFTSGSMTVSVVATPGPSADINQAITAASLPLPTGAATSANQTNGNQETQLVQGGNTATVSAAGALKVDGSAVTQPVSIGAAVTVTQGNHGTAAQGWFTEITDGTNGPAAVKAASTAAAAADPSLVVALSPNSPLPSGTNALGSVTVTGTSAVSGTVTANQGTANSLANAWSTKITDATNGPAAVKAASTQAAYADPALVVSLNPASAQTRASTANVTGVASSASSQTILASNAARLGAIIVNSSTAILYLKYSSGAASNASAGYTVSVAISGGVHEVPFGYTGAITGIWASANGFANVTELSV